MAEAANANAADMQDYVGLKAFWDKLNTDKDNVLSGKEWGKVVNKNLEEFKNFFPGETVQEIGKYFNVADKNDDDQITWREFVAAADIGSLKKLFLDMDRNADGKVSSYEWGRHLNENFNKLKGVFGGKTKREVGKFFSKFNTSKEEVDEEGKQLLTWDEFHAAWAATAVLPEFTELKKLWDQLNENADGVVTSKEWGHLIDNNVELAKKCFGEFKDLAEIGKFFNVIDENHDKKLTWKEVVSARTKLQDLSDLQKVYMQMDKDGDGFVDSKEWGRQLGQFKEQLGEFFMGMSIPELGKMFNEMDKDHDDKISWDEIRTTVIDVHNQHDLKEELAQLEQADNVNEESKKAMEDLLAKIKK